MTTFPEALKIANEFKKLVNERYKLLEIDLDAVFERILLLNKKKYAAVKIDEGGERSTEVKGLDMKRREFAKVSKDASRWAGWKTTMLSAQFRAQGGLIRRGD